MGLFSSKKNLMDANEEKIFADSLAQILNNIDSIPKQQNVDYAWLQGSQSWEKGKVVFLYSDFVGYLISDMMDAGTSVSYYNEYSQDYKNKDWTGHIQKQLTGILPPRFKAGESDKAEYAIILERAERDVGTYKNTNISARSSLMYVVLLKRSDMRVKRYNYFEGTTPPDYILGSRVASGFGRETGSPPAAEKITAEVLKQLKKVT